MTLNLSRLGAALTLGLAATLAQAAGNPLSVHVLDLQSGQPSPGVTVDLERQDAQGAWARLGSAVTDAQGRIRDFFPSNASWRAGQYRVVFRTGEFYAQRQQPSFFPEVPVVFKVEDAGQHYHIPLLLSPYGFSTYRGN